jgi:hypothetical protein
LPVFTVTRLGVERVEVGEDAVLLDEAAHCVDGLRRVVRVAGDAVAIFRIFAPAAFTNSKYAVAPRATDAYEAADPVNGDVPPMTMVVALMPGSAAEPAKAVGSETASAVASAATRAATSTESNASS